MEAWKGIRTSASFTGRSCAVPKGFVRALPSRYDVPGWCARATEILENAPTLLRGGGGFGGRINHTLRGYGSRPRERDRLREHRQIGVELIAHPNTANASRAGLPLFDEADL